MEIILWICLLFGGIAHAVEKTVCLNMIVKNEKDVIRRSLESVKNLIDYWVIVDTGSTDGTQQIIREVLEDVPGELHERPWVNFGYNRNEALQLAKGKGEYVLFIDSDEELHGIFSKNQLDRDVYFVTVCISTDPLVTFQRTLLINHQLDWSWSGIIHEKLNCNDPIRAKEIDGASLENVILFADTKDGSRSKDPLKYLKDAQVLEQALLEDPDESDYVYYLAQCYYNAQELPLAMKNYRKRGKMSGFDQHTFWSKYMVGIIQEMLQVDSESIIHSYCDAYHFRPSRAEPLFRLSDYFYRNKAYLLAYLTARYGLYIPLPAADVVYVEEMVYQYRLLALFGDSALRLGKLEEARESYQKISQTDQAPPELRQKALDVLNKLQSQYTQHDSS